MYKDNFVVSIKVKGAVLRERGNVVYVPFNSYYSIYLKNKSIRRALVDIEVDGKNVLRDNQLLLDSYSSHEIFGFMRDMTETNRFRFIKKTKRIRDYRGDYPEDGTVVVKYRFEKPEKLDEFPVVFYSPDSRSYKSESFVNENITYTSACYNCVDDSGITVKGEKIPQNYVYSDFGEPESKCHTIVLNLRGKTTNKKVVKKPFTVRDRIRCETCGLKNRTKNKFCYNCGTYLD